MQKSEIRKLLHWYRQHRRDLPWRRTSDPYRILLSEIMLQQTQVQTVVPYYHRFLEAFPTFEALAQAPLDRVLKLWEGLGYYARARNLHRLAQTVVQDFDSTLPSDFQTLRGLPGIGRYTAGAVASIAFRQDYPVVDGNVQRVFARYFAIDRNLNNPAEKEKLWSLAESLIPSGEAGDYNQALMELGATICTPQQPHCGLCPIRKGCQALRKNLQHTLPLKKKVKKIPHFDIGAGVIWRAGRILISQRPLKGLLGGLWEFPGGKKERGETLQQCIAREIQEELGVSVKVGHPFAKVKHAYSHFKITLHVHSCTYRSGTPRTIGCRAWKWIAPKELKKYAFPGANQPIIEKILSSLDS